MVYSAADPSAVYRSRIERRLECNCSKQRDWCWSPSATSYWRQLLHGNSLRASAHREAHPLCQARELLGATCGYLTWRISRTFAATSGCFGVATASRNVAYILDLPRAAGNSRIGKTTRIRHEHRGHQPTQASGFWDASLRIWASCTTGQVARPAGGWSC